MRIREIRECLSLIATRQTGVADASSGRLVEEVRAKEEMSVNGTAAHVRRVTRQVRGKSGEVIFISAPSINDSCDFS
jgi:hypothetical protein